MRFTPSARYRQDAIVETLDGDRHGEIEGRVSIGRVELRAVGAKIDLEGHVQRDIELFGRPERVDQETVGVRGRREPRGRGPLEDRTLRAVEVGPVGAAR